MMGRTRLLVIAIMLGACASGVPKDLFDKAEPVAEPRVEFHYLGNGGWLIQRGKDRIATAPFVTNPHGLTLLFPGEPDADRIRTVIPQMDDVEIMLVGHGHYDHAMDLPVLVPMKAPNATIHGSETVVNTLKGARVPLKLRAIRRDDAARGDRPGRWFYNGARTIRVMPLRSTHAPHIAGVKIIPSGRVKTPQTSLPCCPYWWNEGPTFAFIIDFLTNDTVDFRLYYQDSATEPGTGIAPVFAPPDVRRVDVAILCVAAFNQVDGNPEHILANLQPRAVIGGHWEDFFFQPYGVPEPRAAAGTKVEDFHRRARTILRSREPIYLPTPGAKVSVPIR